VSCIIVQQDFFWRCTECGAGLGGYESWQEASDAGGAHEEQYHSAEKCRGE